MMKNPDTLLALEIVRDEAFPEGAPLTIVQLRVMYHLRAAIDILAREKLGQGERRCA